MFQELNILYLPFVDQVLKNLKLQFLFFLDLRLFLLLFRKLFLSENKLVCSIIQLWSKDNIFSPVRYLYLSTWPDDNVDIFVPSLLISYCSFPCLILSAMSWLVIILLLKDCFWNVKDYLMQGSIIH